MTAKKAYTETNSEDFAEKVYGADSVHEDNLPSIEKLVGEVTEQGANKKTTHLEVLCAGISMPTIIPGPDNKPWLTSEPAFKGERHPLEAFGSAMQIARLIGMGAVKELAL